MDMNLATQSFTALGHPGRLAVFRLLMRFAPQGVRPTELAETLALRQNTLSHYLNDLEAAGLIKGARQGRSILYAIDLDRTGALVDYLVEDCCRGRPDLCPTPTASATAVAKGDQPYNVLFICSGNSARSIFAESILNTTGNGRFRAYSAGTRPGTQLNPFAVEVLQRNGMDVSTLRSKHISEFEAADAPKMDFVFTVCDAAAAEECAPWPGQPLSAHWGVPDPVKAVGTDAEKGLAFARAFAELHRRILAFAALPLEQLDRLSIQRRVDDIGQDKA